MFVAIKDLEPGDLVELEGDEYADPDGTNPYFPVAYARVSDVLRETQQCWLLEIEERGTYSFPPEHEVYVVSSVRHP